MQWLMNSCFAVVLLISMAASPAFAGIILNFNIASGNIAANNDQSVGWRFNVLSTLTVTHLTWFDQDLDGLSSAHTVGLWDPSGVFLGTATIPAGNVVPLDGIWRTAAVTPFVLTPGDGYIVGGTNTNSTTDRLAANVMHVVDPRIAFVNATFSDFTAPDVLVRPTQLSRGISGFYGPSFNVQDANAVPEPATLSMFVVGALGLGGAAPSSPQAGGLVRDCCFSALGGGATMAGMTFAEIDVALATRGIHLDPSDESFMDGNCPLRWSEVLALLPDATDVEIASWAEDRAAKLRK